MELFVRHFMDLTPRMARFTEAGLAAKVEKGLRDKGIIWILEDLGI